MPSLKPILPPRDLLSPAKHRRAIEEALNLGAAAGIQELLSTIRGWRHGTRFRVEKTSDGRNLVTDDPIFLYQDQGTKAHSIRPRRKRFLRFAGRSGTVYTKHVNHPGTKAQHYSEKAAAKMQRQFERIMAQKLAEASR